MITFKVVSAFASDKQEFWELMILNGFLFICEEQGGMYVCIGCTMSSVVKVGILGSMKFLLGKSPRSRDATSTLKY
jgi:hypothetical protein